ncbi:MAG: hypothetical protein WCL39_16120 [Armatimonadota bacterium]
MTSDGLASYPLFLVGFVLLCLILMIFSYYAEKKRREELLLESLDLGLTFDQDDPFSIETRYEFFSWIDQGHNRTAYNVMYGTVDDFEIKAFDYRFYTMESGHNAAGNPSSNESLHDFSAIIADTKCLFKELHIKPEGFFDRIGDALGFADIDFESDEFSRAYCVKGPDKKFAYDMIHPRMMELLMVDRRWSMEFKANCVMLVLGTSNFTPDQIKDGIARVRQMMSLIPDYLKQQIAIGGAAQ